MPSDFGERIVGLFLFHRKDLVILTYESEHLSYEIKNAPRGLHCGGMVDVADATRRRRRILRSRILFLYGIIGGNLEFPVNGIQKEVNGKIGLL